MSTTSKMNLSANELLQYCSDLYLQYWVPYQQYANSCSTNLKKQNKTKQNKTKHRKIQHFNVAYGRNV